VEYCQSISGQDSPQQIYGIRSTTYPSYALNLAQLWVLYISNLCATRPQRARNENTNGLIRQYLPKSSSFDDISIEQIEQIEFAINHRPRKTLGWYTPSEVMAVFYTVALAD